MKTYQAFGHICWGPSTGGLVMNYGHDIVIVHELIDSITAEYQILVFWPYKDLHITIIITGQYK